MLAQDVVRRGYDWMFTSSMVTTRLDALLSLGRHEEVEQEAAPLASSRSVLRPFALRALGSVREDPQLLQDAVERFEKFGLDWHAEETRLVLQA
jgi:hypothetical protein